MRRFLAMIPNFSTGLASSLLVPLLFSLSGIGLGDAVGSEESAADSATGCAANSVIPYQFDASPPSETICGILPRTPAEIAAARAYVIETAQPGYTMTRQGPELAVSRLHPEFVVRPASAIREARKAGLAFAGVFSAYRPPAFGVGGFANKFHSLHAYGLAVDLFGIGNPGSQEALLWHEIAARNGVVCPYGPWDRAEWNHCQPTSVKIIMAENPLRDTVTAEGPSDLGDMFEAGNPLIESMASAADSLFRATPMPVRLLEAFAGGSNQRTQMVVEGRAKRTRVAMRRVVAKSARHSKVTVKSNRNGNSIRA
jgi:hypothetical protein